MKKKKKPSLFPPSSVQVSLRCDTEGPIETEIYLHCSVVCISLALNYIAWSEQITGVQQENSECKIKKK